MCYIVFIARNPEHKLPNERGTNQTMSTKSKTPTPALPAEVRAWANANGFDIGVRGRISDDVRDRFNRAKRGRKVYVGSHPETQRELVAA